MPTFASSQGQIIRAPARNYVNLNRPYLLPWRAAQASRNVVYGSAIRNNAVNSVNAIKGANNASRVASTARQTASNNTEQIRLTKVDMASIRSQLEDMKSKLGDVERNVDDKLTSVDERLQTIINRTNDLTQQTNQNTSDLSALADVVKNLPKQSQVKLQLVDRDGNPVGGLITQDTNGVIRIPAASLEVLGEGGTVLTFRSGPKGVMRGQLKDLVRPQKE